ncbi:MAG: hypothetical protein RBU30_00360 [Polyangia bacterium]|nr:hypothetical protein [Polyangia bacterium]
MPVFWLRLVGPRLGLLPGFWLQLHVVRLCLRLRLRLGQVGLLLLWLLPGLWLRLRLGQVGLLLLWLLPGLWLRLRLGQVGLLLL